VSLKITRKFIVDFIDRGLADDLSSWKLYKSQVDEDAKIKVDIYTPYISGYNIKMRVVSTVPNCILEDIE